MLNQTQLISYSQACSPIPYSIHMWSEWAEGVQSADEIPGNRLAEKISDLITLRSWIKSYPEIDPLVKTTKLLEMDEMLEQWPNDLPSYWSYKTTRNYQHDREDDDDTQFGLEQYRYADLYAASMWLSCRSARIQLHQTLMPLVMSDSTLSPNSKEPYVQRSRQVLKEMTAGICRSVAFIMGDIPSTADHNCDPKTSPPQDPSNGPPNPAPGGYMLIWPLYMVGMLDTTTKSQRYWISKVLERIGRCSGASLAISRSKALLVAAEDDFRESEDWPYIKVADDPATI
jgi:hypothetical protein